MGRVLCLDYGMRKLGFALSDPTGLLAFPHSVERCATPQEAEAIVVRMVEETGAEQLVVGLPLSMDGSDSEVTTATRAFVDRVRGKLDVPVATWDERWSTRSAENALIEAGTRRARRKGVIDKVAAQIILQNYLDAQGGEEEWRDGVLE